MNLNYQMSAKSVATRSRQSKLAPRFAKQKEKENRLNTLSNEAFTTTAKLVDDIKAMTLNSKSVESSDKSVKDTDLTTTSVVNAWAKPLSHTQTTAISSTITTSTKTVTNTTNSISHDLALSVSSKSSSFDQHDSGIDVSDQPPSTASSQRSSPSSEESKLITTTAKVSSTTDVRAEIVSFPLHFHMNS